MAILDMNNFFKVPSPREPWSLDEKRAVSALMKEARKNARPSTCILCNKPLAKSCNSHSIPRFVLKNIASSGRFYTTNVALKMPGLEEEKGINNFETFYTICPSCDSSMFKDYENPDNWTQEPTPAMLFQIALKNYLWLWSKRLKEDAQYKLLERQFGTSDFLEMKKALTSIDKQDYEHLVSTATGRNRSQLKYKIDLLITLPYRIPIAFQGAITVIAGFNGQLINNVYNLADSKSVQELHICVFPLEKSSVVLCFTNKKHNRYRSFFKELNTLKRDEQLSVILYLLLAYEESIAFSNTIDTSFFENELVLDVMGKEQTILRNGHASVAELGKYAAECYSCEAAFELPNLLSSDFAVDF